MVEGNGARGGPGQSRGSVRSVFSGPGAQGGLELWGCGTDGDLSDVRCQGCRTHSLRGASEAMVGDTRAVKVKTAP